jgi:transmembrane protein 17
MFAFVDTYQLYIITVILYTHFVPFLCKFLCFQVPELAGFWLLTLLIQFPLILLVLFNEDAKILPFERAVNIIEALFVLFEIICGYIAIRIMVNYQVTKFHLRQFTDLEQMPDDDYWLDQGQEAHEHYS